MIEFEPPPQHILLPAASHRAYAELFAASIGSYEWFKLVPYIFLGVMRGHAAHELDMWHIPAISCQSAWPKSRLGFSQHDSSHWQEQCAHK